MTSTENRTKSIARQTGLTVAAVREAAKDLGLRLDYSPLRRAWFIDEPAVTVRRFVAHLEELAAA